MLIKESVTVIDDLKPQDHPALQLSNFCMHEDRESGEVAAYVPYWPLTTPEEYTGEVYRYRVEV